MKILKTKLLFSLASEEDFLTKTEGYRYRSYRFLYYRLSEFENGSVRDAAARLTREGAIDKIIRNGQPFFRLTAVGREKLLKKIPIYKGQRKVWDRTWRMIVISGLEGQSRLVQRKLTDLGYQRIARGVYITPLAVTEATKQVFLDEKWTNQATIIESRRLVIGDDLRLARRLWKLDDLARKYADFVNFSQGLLKKARQNIILLQQSKGGYKQLFDIYFNLLLDDPGLPKRLLASDWQADKAKEMFLRLAEMAKTAAV